MTCLLPDTLIVVEIYIMSVAPRVTRTQESSRSDDLLDDRLRSHPGPGHRIRSRLYGGGGGRMTVFQEHGFELLQLGQPFLADMDRGMTEQALDE